jgi:UDP-glucose 4-epimerase
MNILITGGTSFIGSYCIRDLMKEGHLVVSLNRNPDFTLINQLLNKNEIAKVKFEKGNVADLPNLMRIARGNKIEGVIHLAAAMYPQSEQVKEAVETNVIGTFNVFELAKELKLRRVVNGGSISVFGRLRDVIGSDISKALFDEKHLIYNPTRMYGATKALGEYMASHYNRTFGTDIISLRIPRVYGTEKLTGSGVQFTTFLQKIAREEPATIENGDDALVYMYVEDAAALICKTCLTPKTKTKIFNMHEGGHYTGWQLASILKEINPQVKITVKPGKGVYDTPALDNTAMNQELGFTPKYSIKEGMKLVLNDMRERINLPPFK